MKRFVSRALYATLFTGGLVLLGAGAAHASDTTGEDGILSGTQLGISVELPVTISGNAVSVIGDSESSDATTEVATGGGEAASSEPVAVTSGEDGIGSGSQAIVDVSAPVTVSGNAVSVVGDSSSSGATTEVASGGGSGEADATTSGEDSILGGTQGIVDVSAPVTIGGNAVSVIGDSSSEDADTGVATGSGASDEGNAWTSGEDSILGGTQVLGSVDAPVTIGGNAVSVIGDSTSEDATTAVMPGSGSGGDASTSGEDSILGGTQILPDLSLPVTIGGNAVSVIGDSTSEDATTAVMPGSGSGGDASTSGEDSILGGTQILPDLSLPITIGGNAVSVIGDSSSEDATTAVMPGTGSGGDASTSGEDSILGGTQVLGSVDAPVTIGGNAVSVIGDSSSEDATTTVMPGSGSGGDASTSGEDSILGGTQILPDLSLPVTIGGNAVSVIGDSSTDGSTTIVSPVDPTDPTDPTDPVDPTDPTDPTTPGTPGDGGDAGTSGSGMTGSATTVASSDAMTAVSAGALASTGLDTGFWERLALFLALTGALLLGVRRFALRR